MTADPEAPEVLMDATRMLRRVIELYGSERAEGRPGTRHYEVICRMITLIEEWAAVRVR